MSVRESGDIRNLTSRRPGPASRQEGIRAFSKNPHQTAQGANVCPAIKGVAVPHAPSAPRPQLARGMNARARNINPVVPSMKNGGYVKKTGIYRLHKGEHVIPASQAQDHVRSMGSPKKKGQAKKAKL